jgi:hypothetical protein
LCLSSARRNPTRNEVSWILGLGLGGRAASTVDPEAEPFGFQHGVTQQHLGAPPERRFRVTGYFRCSQQSYSGVSPDYPVLESGQTVFMNVRHADRKQQSPAGLLRDSLALSCARRVQRPSDPQVFDQFVANRIKQLPYGLVCEICDLCSRSALTRRMSAVRSRQHPPINH